MEKQIENFKNFVTKIDKNYFILFLITCFILAPYFSNEIVLGHDSSFHITNIKGMVNSLESGLFFPSKILENNLNTFGYGVHIFYPSILYYVSSYISYIFSIGIIGSLKITFFIVIYLSAISMYELMRKIVKNKDISLISSVFYITNSYFLSDIFIRFALGELGVFIFAPLTILGVHMLIYEDKKWLLILAAVGMINSHTVLTMYFIFFIIIYLFINIKQIFNFKILKNLVISSILIVLLVLPFVGPMFEHKIYGDYAVFDDGHMVNNITNIGERRGLEVYNYVKNLTYNNIVFLVQPCIIVLAILSLINYKKIIKNDVMKKIFIFNFIMCLVSFVLTLKFIDWSYLPAIMSYIQFPWRMVTFLSIGLSMLAAFGVMYFDKKYYKIILVFLIVFSLNFTIDLFPFSNLNNVSSNKLNSIVHIGSQKEYLPVSTHSDLDYYFNRDNEVLIKSGIAQIDVLLDETPSLTLKVFEVNETVILELPRIFYLGYKISYETDNDLINLDYYENNNGFIEILLPEEDGVLTMVYSGTAINKICNYLFIGTIIFGLLYYLYNYIKKIVV